MNLLKWFLMVYLFIGLKMREDRSQQYFDSNINLGSGFLDDEDLLLEDNSYDKVNNSRI